MTMKVMTSMMHCDPLRNGEDVSVDFNDSEARAYTAEVAWTSGCHTPHCPQATRLIDRQVHAP